MGLAGRPKFEGEREKSSRRDVDGGVLSESDRAFLDQAFDAALDAFESGREPSVEDVAGSRGHLLGHVLRVIELARELAPGAGLMGALGAESGASAVPTVPGYSIKHRLGQGGMGAVYLASQESLGHRMVALKVLPAGAALSARARERFRTESAAIAKLNHPHIVQVYDTVFAPGIHAFAMEWVDGRTLQAIIDELADARGVGLRGESTMEQMRHALDAPQEAMGDADYPRCIARIGREIAGALACVHAAGMLHRDIKPSNILLRRDGGAMLSDFGLARSGLDAINVSVTQADNFAGTPAYAPPEQLRGQRRTLDQRADIYALGVTLYHALAMRPPFAGNSIAGLLEQIERGRATPLREIVLRMPSELETIISKAMDQDPARRYASAEQLADDLDRFLSDRPILARPATRSYLALKFAKRNKVLVGGVIAVVLALVLGLAGTAIGLRRAIAQREIADRRAAESRLEQYVASIQAAEAAIKGDECRVAQAQLLSAPQEHRGWEWRWLWSRTEQSLRTFDPRFGFGNQLVAYAGVPDRSGRRMPWVVNGQVLIFDLHEWRMVASWEPKASWRTTSGGNWQVAISPDGQRAALVDRYYTASEVELAIRKVRGVLVVDAMTGAFEREIGELWPRANGDGTFEMDVMSLGWTPDGTGILVQSNKGADIEVFRVSDGRSIACREPRGRWNEGFQPTFDDSGTRIVVPAGNTGLIAWDISTGQSRVLPMTVDAYHSIGHPKVSPDGKWIAVTDRRGLTLIDWETLASFRRLDTAGENHGYSSFSRDGKRVYYSLGERVRGYDVATGERIMHARGVSQGGAYVFEGPEFGTTVHATGSYESVRLMSESTSDGRLELRGFECSSMTPNGRYVLLDASTLPGSDGANEVIDLDTGESKRYPARQGDRHSRVALSPSGRYLVRMHGEQLRDSVTVIDRQSESRGESAEAIGRRIELTWGPSFLVEFSVAGGRETAWLQSGTSVVALDLETLEVVRKVPVGAGQVGFGFLDPGGERIASSLPSGEVIVTPVDGAGAGTGVRMLLPGWSLSEPRFSPNGDRIVATVVSQAGVTGGSGVELFTGPAGAVFETSTGRLIGTFGSGGAPALGIGFGVTGDRLLVARLDGSFCVFAIVTMPGAATPVFREVLRIREGTYWLQRPSMSSDGERILVRTAWPAGRVFVYDARPHAFNWRHRHLIQSAEAGPPPVGNADR